MTWKALLTIMGAFSTFMLGAIVKGVSRSEEIVATATSVQSQKIARLEEKVDMNKVQADESLLETRKDIQAVYQYLLTRQRQPRLEKQ